jgi:phthiodiolone/phenolphthiodiolone dimycocerosates ketoreductase
MSHPKIDVGMYVAARPPLGSVEALVAAARDQQLDSVFVWDHFQDFFPSAIWDEEFAWFAAPGSSPHEPFEFQTLLGYLARRDHRDQLAALPPEVRARGHEEHQRERAPEVGLPVPEPGNAEQSAASSARNGKLPPCLPTRARSSALCANSGPSATHRGGVACASPGRLAPGGW